MPGSVRERYSNDVFFAGVRRGGHETVVPEHAFYAGRARPPPEPGFAERAASTPLRFALLLFLGGWVGILFQRSFFQQIVFGAPVFEEIAKFGPALLVATLLGVRSPWVRLPLAWLFGGAFGVMEHHVTYFDEPLWLYVERVVFHATSTGLSMLVYAALEGLVDFRARWGATLPATLLHWAFNFGGVVLGVSGVFLPSADTVSGAYAVLITGSVVVLTLWGILDRAGFEARTRRIFAAAVPRLGWVERT